MSTSPRVHRRDPREVRRLFIDDIIVSVGGTLRGSGPPSSRTSIDACLFIRGLVRKYGGVPIYMDGAGWCADACRWAGAEHAVHDRPLRNLMERMVQYAKEGTEAFDDPFPVGGRRLASGRAFERMHNWLSA
ncbi:MAG: hypothetical protein JHC24_02640, partial [Thaumarchaeota archaeon]|nr:hypothetical protein [Nitrososphaerota archaeon]